MTGFEVAVVVPGLLAWARIRSARGPASSVYRVALEAVAVHTVVSTLVGVGLFSVGAFDAGAAQALAALVPLVLLLLRPPARVPGASERPAITRLELSSLLVLLLVSPVAFPRMELLYMQADAGVYSNRAIHHLFNGSTTGRVPVYDKLDGELRSAFQRDNLTRHGGSSWTFLPGTYPTDPDAESFHFQFYPGWPLFMAQWAWAFGLSRMFFAVLWAFALGVLLFGALLEDRGLGWLAHVTTVALFASSPLLIYFSKYPTSEIFLLFLFLFVVYFLSSRGGPASALAIAGVAALAVTHVSTFLYAPLPGLVALEAHRSADRRLASFAAGAFAVLLGGLALGVLLAPAYVFDIYRSSFGRLGIRGSAFWGLAAIIGFYVGSLLLSGAVLRRARGADPRVADGDGWTEQEKGAIAAASRVLMGTLIAWTAYQAYRLGWTDHFAQLAPRHGAWAARSGYGGTGWAALLHMNALSMAMGTALVGLPFVFGVSVWRVREVCATHSRAFLLAAVLLSVSIYTFVRFDTPTNYYASRYFIPVLIPAAMLLFGELLEVFRLGGAWILALALVGLTFNGTFDRALYLHEGHADEMRFIEEVAGRVGDHRVLFIRNHRRDHRLVQRLLALPLANIHGIPVVNVVDRPGVPVDQRIAGYARHLNLRDAAVLARRPPADDRPFEAISLVRRHLRPEVPYPYRPVERRDRYYLYDLGFER